MMKKTKKQNPVEPEAVAAETEKSPPKQHYTRENFYAYINLSVRQMDVIIAVLVTLLVLAIVIGIIIK